jgi:hypothetical protein
VDYRFQIGITDWHYHIDEQGLTVRAGWVTHQVRWADVTGAGVATMPAALSQLLIAHRPAGKGKKLLTLNVPDKGAEREALLEEVRRRAGQAWIAEQMSGMKLRRALGFSTWWSCPLVALLMLLVAGVGFSVLFGAAMVLGTAEYVFERYALWIIGGLVVSYFAYRFLRAVKY